jgi:MFS family permease
MDQLSTLPHDARSRLCHGGYDIDWAVISGINAFPAWNTYFGVASSGVTFGTINALMNIGNFRETPFLSFADTIGRRGIKFVGNAIVIATALLQAFLNNMSML